eukprot:3359984-Alexandrium_andersonii.AAC.1
MALRSSKDGVSREPVRPGEAEGLLDPALLAQHITCSEAALHTARKEVQQAVLVAIEILVAQHARAEALEDVGPLE